MTVDERLLAAELRNCNLGCFSQAGSFVLDVHAKPAGYELSDRQRAYLFHLGYRYRKQLPEFLSERSEEFRQQAATLYAQAEGASTKKVKPQKAGRAEAVDDPDCSSPMLPLFMNGGFLG